MNPSPEHSRGGRKIFVNHKGITKKSKACSTESGAESDLGKGKAVEGLSRRKTDLGLSRTLKALRKKIGAA